MEVLIDKWIFYGVAWAVQIAHATMPVFVLMMFYPNTIGAFLSRLIGRIIDLILRVAEKLLIIFFKLLEVVIIELIKLLNRCAVVLYKYPLFWVLILAAIYNFFYKK